MAPGPGSGRGPNRKWADLTQKWPPPPRPIPGIGPEGRKPGFSPPAVGQTVENMGSDSEVGGTDPEVDLPAPFHTWKWPQRAEKPGFPPPAVGTAGRKPGAWTRNWEGPDPEVGGPYLEVAPAAPPKPGSGLRGQKTWVFPTGSRVSRKKTWRPDPEVGKTDPEVALPAPFHTRKWFQRAENLGFPHRQWGQPAENMAPGPGIGRFMTRKRVGPTRK
ncbi:hypothetical protein BTVI_05631 [Pitangus sulphuratus]|nr:hypothetical protein BTVI_05631 [Pitangus sulphuratus]